MRDLIDETAAHVMRPTAATVFAPTVARQPLAGAARGQAESSHMRLVQPRGQSVQLGSDVVRHELAGRPSIPGSLNRLIDEADRQIAAGRLETALDSTLLAETVEPTCLPLYVRHAELLLATNRGDAAVALAHAIGRFAELAGDDDLRVDVDRILTHASPTGTNVRRLARTLLDAGQANLADRYVPAAIDAAVAEGDASEVVELARRWSALSDHREALYVLARELLRAGQRAEAHDLFQDRETIASDAWSLVARLASSSAVGDPEQWALGVELAHHVTTRQIPGKQVRALLDELAGVLPTDATFRIHRGLIELATGHHESAQSLLAGAATSDPVARYIAMLGATQAALATGNYPAARVTMVQTLEYRTRPDVRRLAERIDLPLATDLATTGVELAEALTKRGAATDAVDLLRSLIAAFPDDARLSRAYGEALARIGQREVATAHLEELLRRQDAAGSGDEAIETMRSLLLIVPGNLRLRHRLVDEFMKRGKLTEAINERYLMAQILERAGHVDEAVAKLRHAVEVGSMAGDWRTIQRLYDYMIAIRPDDLDIRHGAVTTAIEYGQIAPAAGHLWDVVGISVDRKEADEAIAALHQIIALTPNDTGAYHKLGEVLAGVGEYAQAERVYRRLASLLPDDPAVRAKQLALAALAKGSS